MTDDDKKVTLTYYNGDRESFVDSYRRFIDFYLPPTIIAYAAKNKLYARFIEKKKFENDLILGVHQFYTKSLYKMLFR